MTNKSYFYCYNPKMRRFIQEICLIYWVDKGVNPKNNFPFWVFERSKELDEAISLYQNKE